MSRAVHTACLAAVALLFAGCGAAAQESSADRFQGEERRVAQVVDDLESAGVDKDAAEICSRILAKPVVDRLSAGSGDCVAEIEKALTDADEFELEVERVQVSGTTATARVADGTGRTQTIGFVREGRDWRATSLAAS